MKKLFKVVDREDGKTVEYFEDKPSAKILRDMLNPNRGDDFIQGTQERHFVAKGPDHRHYS